MVELKKIERITNNTLRYFDNIMNKNNIEYILFAGTCLGFYRDKGYIKGDNDIDIIIKFESKDQVDKIINIMTKEGFSLTQKNSIVNERIIKKYGEVYSNLNFHNSYYVLIDIFFAYKIDNYYYIHTKWRFESTLLDELGTLEYHYMKFKVPKNIEKYLDDIYINWRVPTIRENCKDKSEWQGHKSL